MSAVQNNLDAIANAVANIEDELAKGKGIEIVKSTKDNGRFKNTSVWVKLPNGKYQHLQSGKVAKASRLAGFTTLVYKA